jgi:hypothetical protein
MTADLDRYIALTPGPKDWRGYSNRAWLFINLDNLSAVCQMQIVRC